MNTPDRICRLNSPLLKPPTVLPWPVFVANSDFNSPTMNWLGTLRNASRLAELALNPEESLQVYRNAIVLIGDSQRATSATLDRLCDLADGLRETEATGPVDGLPFAVENLPKPFQVLEPLIRRFAVGDDGDRTEILRASPEELKRLREKVGPLLPQINTFLGSFGDRPLSNEAVLLGYLAEAVAELGCQDSFSQNE